MAKVSLFLFFKINKTLDDVGVQISCTQTVVLKTYFMKPVNSFTALSLCHSFLFPGFLCPPIKTFMLSSSSVNLIGGASLRTGMINVFYKRPHSEYSQLWRPDNLSSNDSALSLHWKNSHGQCINEWVWLCFSKILFTKRDGSGTQIWPRGHSLRIPVLEHCFLFPPHQ